MGMVTTYDVRSPAVVVVVVSHIQRIGCQPEKTTLHGGQSRSSWSAQACVCVLCFLPIHSGHQVCWMYQPESRRRKVTQDFSSTFFLSAVRALIFLARRIQPFLSLVDCEVEFCVLTI